MLPRLNQRQSAIGLLIIIFTLGMITGGSVAKLLMAQSFSSTANNQALLDDLSRATNLNISQRKQIEEILYDAGKQHNELRLQIRPQHIAITETARNRIRSILSPTQLRAYELWLSETAIQPKKLSPKSEQK